jgi:hypothetical protein
VAALGSRLETKAVNNVIGQDGKNGDRPPRALYFRDGLA